MSQQPQMLTVVSARQDGAVVVSLTGELDMATVGQASTALKEAVETGAPVVLDLTGLQFFSSAGLNMLLQLHEDARERQLDVRLAGDQRAVARPLELTGLIELFPVYPSVTAALAARSA
ncbi:MAG TPA: STAS domain-containing protein [Pseudonocardiaceae bacterium]|nr:STAS domain-containing protein [Pseudonocardiaceae bacterium]